MFRDPAAAELLAAALQDSDQEVRHRVAIALADLGDRRAAPQLLASLRRSEPQIRQESALLLGQLGDRRVGQALATLLGIDRVADVRAAAATALGQLRDANALPMLFSA